MSERKDLYGDNKPKRTLRKAHAVKRSRALRRGVAGVAVASTLAMMLPSVVASALQPTQKDIIDASNTTQKMGKGKPDVEELNMQRWGAGVLKKSAQTQKFVELARHDAQMQKLREAQQREIEQREINKSEAKQHESQQQEAQQSEIDSQLGSSNAVGPAGSAAVSAPASVQNTNAQPSSTHEENTNTVSAANTPRGRVRRSVVSGDGASNGSSVPSAANVPASPAASSANNAASTSNATSANNAPTSTTAAPANNAPAPSGTPAANTVTPSTPVTPASTGSNAGAGTTANPSTDTTAQGNKQKQGAEGSAQGSQTNAQGSQSSAEGATAGATGENKNGAPSTTGSASASEPGSASSNNQTSSEPTSAPVSTPSPASTSNTGTPNAPVQNTGTATNNAATDPNSQVIKPNTDNPTADSTEQANSQVQTDKKPEVTYNLQIRYTIGGAANKQLVQPYELTIDKEDFDKIGKDNKYEYIELPKSAGYRPSVYHSGDYQYYVKKGEGDKSEFVVDDGTNADAVRYLRLNKKLITDYAVKKRPAVGGNNVAQAPQTSSSQATTNPQSSSSTQPKAEDGIQYYGELNINYAPKTAKYYVRHLVQNLKDKDKFDEAPNIGKPIFVEHKIKDKNGKVTTTKEVIHVTEITGTVGSDVTAVSTYIPGYEPEHNLISSPLSDSEDEKDKLVLNLRYYRKAYEVTYDSVGGTDVTAQKVYYDQKVPPVPEPTYRGHTFLGWQVVKPGDSSSSGPLIKGTSTNYKMPDHNVQFRAAWSANAATNYRVNVWVQKADLVDKEHPNSLANYDFVGLVERKNVKTDSDVALDKMNDAGVIDDTSKLNGESVDNYVENPELGLTREELQGTQSDHKDGLIAKFNWMNDTDTAVTDLDGYDTEHPGAATNKGKDLFTRYFHVNKKLTKELNNEQHDFVPGRPDLGKRSKSQLCADDLNNTLNLVYDRKEYELIFAKPAVLKSSEDAERLNNAAIKRKDKDGKTTIYCYAGGGNCSTNYDDNNEDDDGNTINHKGYRVNVRYGQSLTDIWPNANELDFGEDTGSLGWRIGYAGDVEFRDTPPFRFTKKEFADPKFRVVGNKHELKISDNPDSDPNNTYELKDNQRLITADTSNIQVMPIQVIIEKQSIASAKKHKKGDTISDDDYVLSTDSYSKDDTSSPEYLHKSSSIAGFNSVDKEKRIETHESDDFDDTLLSDLYSHSIEYEKNGEKDWDDLDDNAKEVFKKEYHVGFRNHLAGGDEDSTAYNENGYLVFKYKRKSYFVQFYNADGNAISAGTGSSDVAKEKLPFEYSLTKRGNAKLKGKDADLYYDGGNVKSYDASVTKDDAKDTSKQLDGKYTFTLNGKTYSIIRPDYLPEDYVFKGWAVDQAGTRFINGEDKDITVPVNGIKLYAAWGLPTNIQHTVTLDYQMHEIGEDGKEGPNVIKTFMCNHNDPIHENDIKIPVRKGFDFYGWELVKKGNEVVEANTPYAFGNKVVEDITLRAVWVQDTRYNGTFKHVFLKPGVTFDDYKNAATKEAKAALVDHISTQTVSGLREHLRYNAEAVYSDETHFPDKHFTSFEASSDENDNTGEFVYQTYNTRKYRVRYVTIEDGKEKDLLPESEVSSVNRKYDVAFYKPIEGFMPETTQQNIEYATDEDGKQIGEKTITFKYKDVRVLKRKCYPPKDTEHPQDTEYQDPKHPQYRPDHYTRYVFKVAKDQSSMGSVVDWQGSKVADGSALVYDAIKGTKAYQMPLPTVKAKPGFEFAGWTSKIGSYAHGSAKLDYATGLTRLPIRSEEQNSPEVIYIANFKLKAPVAAAPQVLTPTEQISTTSGESAKKLITNANEYPKGATFSFAPDEKFDSTPGLHKIKVQVKLDGNTAEAEVLYRVLPDLVYASDWDKFKTTDYGSNNAKDYVPITFTGKNDEGTIIGHDTTGTTPSTGGTTTLTAYVYKGKDVRIRVPQAFGADHSSNKYHYVFKGWATKVVEPTVENPNPEQKFDINSSDRYADANLQDGVTYHAVYKKIDYFSSSSDGGEVPKDAVVAIFKPAPGRLWNDGTSGPKVFYVKKGTDLEKITKEGSQALDWLNKQLTGAKGTWSRSSMLNDGKKVDPVPNVADSTDKWKVNESFQEFVANQEPLSTPEVESNTLLAIRGDKTTLPEPKDYIANYSVFDGDNKNPNVESVTVEYASTAPTVDKAGVYTVPLIVSVKYKDVEKPVPYKTVGKLKVMHDLIYGENVKDLGANPTKDDQSEHDKIASEYKKVNFITNNSYGTMASGSRTLFYAHTNKTSGVRAPQAIGKDYDADGYHYEFVGWKKLDNFTKDNSSAELLTTDNVKPNEILQSSSIFKNAYDANTTYQAVYKRVENVIDAKSKDKIPDNYVPYVFTPGFGRIWDDGSYNPKVVYFNPKTTTYRADINKKADSIKGGLVGFNGWSTYDATGNIIEDVDNELKNNGVKKTLLFVAKQAHIKDVNVSDIVLGVGDTIPSPENLVHSDDSADKPKLVGISGNGGDYYSSSGILYNPGITTVTVEVMQKTDEKDKNGKIITKPKDIPIHISVLPNVIAQQDLPATDTKEFRYIAQNYTKVTYVVGNGGEMKSPVFTYWVRKGAKNVHMPVPDVLADKGYVFKDWSSVTKNYSLDFTKSKFATDEQKEFLAERADLAGLSFIAKQIRASKHSSFAALKNLLDLGGKENGITFNLDETIITANFEQMKKMKFKFSGSAREGIFTNFRLQNITEGSGDANNKITVDGNEVTINELVAKGLTSVNGINATCAGTECKISGTPKIVDGKPKVELTFTTTDEYGRQAEITVEIDVISESKPAPAPVPDFAPSVIPEAQVMEPEVEQPEPEEPQPEPESKPVLAKTGSDTSRVASAGILSAAIAAIGLTVVKTGKHHRKRRNNK